MTTGADKVQAPTLGNIFSASVTTSSSSAVDLDDTEQTYGRYEGRYWTFVMDVDGWIAFGAASGMAAIDETVDGDGDEPWPMAAGVPQSFWITKNSRYFKHKGSAAGTISYRPS